MSIAGIMKKLESQRVSIATWTIIDLLAVIFIAYASSAILYIALLELVGDNKTTLRIARYAGSFLALFVPLFWVKTRYGLPKEVLGLKKGDFHLSFLIIIGIGTALIYSLLLRMTPLWRDSAISNVPISDYHIFLILLPVSIDGFATLVLTPISEEVMDRGFIYGYLRGRVGIALGLILQALFFSLSHPSYIYGDAFYLIGMRFLDGLILGILYEATGSIYPSIIFHGMTNYLAIILSMAWK